MNNIIDILDTEYKIELLVTAMDQYQKRCITVSKQPIQGERTGEAEKKQGWANRAEDVGDLLHAILTEMH